MKVNALKWAVWSENEYSKPRVLAYRGIIKGT